MTLSVPGQAADCGVPLDFVNAKLRGRRSRLYEGDRLRELARERTATDLALRLYPREDIRTPVALERRMTSACAADLASVLRHLEGVHRDLFGALLALYPLENLKVLLRLFTGEGHGADPAAHLIELPPALSLPVADLMSSAEVGEFLERIPIPSLRQCTLEALPIYRRTQKRAYLEMALDKGYWQGVWQQVGRLTAADRRACSAPVRSEFDAMALLGTLRAAQTYKLPWEDWLAVMARRGGPAGARALRAIYERPDLGHARERLPWLDAALRRRLPQDRQPDLGHAEEALWHEAVYLADRQYYAEMSGPAVLVSYFYLKREELRHLMAVTQMLRYGETQDRILEHLDL